MESQNLFDCCLTGSAFKRCDFKKSLTYQYVDVSMLFDLYLICSFSSRNNLVISSNAKPRWVDAVPTQHIYRPNALGYQTAGNPTYAAC